MDQEAKTLEQEHRAEAADPLLACLVAIARHYDRPSSRTVLTAGLPLLNEPMAPDLFLRAAERIGLSARVTRHSIRDLIQLYLPCVVYLKGRRPVVAMRALDDGRIELFMPEVNGIGTIGLKELEDLYLGFCILVKPEFRSRDIGASSLSRSDGHWFWGTVRGYWRNYASIVLAAAFINILALATPLFIMNVYDRVLPNKALATLWVLALGLILALVFDLLLKSARALVIDRVGRRVDIRLSSALFSKILNTRLSHRPTTTGSFANRIGEYELIREFFTSNTVALITDLFFVVLFLIVIHHLVSWVVLIPIIGVVLVVIAGFIIQYLMGRCIAAAREDAALRHSLLVESVAALETVKSMRAEGYLLRKWENLVRHGSYTQQQIKSLSSAGINFSGFVQQMISVWIVIGGAYLFDEGTITTGAIIATVMLANRTVAPLGQLAMTMVRARHAFLAIKGLNEIMGQPDETTSALNFVNRPVEHGRIEFRKVEFAYPGNDRKVLDGVSLKIEPGEKVGIIGRIGSGKTTLGRLIAAFYYPSAGEILIDGIDIRQYHPHEIRKAIALVVQDGDLFHGSLKENIVMAAPEATDEEILKAARLSGVEEFVSQHPMGFDMPVGERGSFLSGGQRQAVALTRALVNKAKVLFLDEPSSSMDISTERMIIQRLQEAIQAHHTIIISTHRHSILSLVDRLIVIDQGRIVADGRKQDVLAALADRSAGQRRTPAGQKTG